jgi:amidase
MVQHLSPTGEFGAFCSGARVELRGRSAGPLRGLKFAAKDNLDVEGFVTGAGSPDWKETHTPARFTAHSICQLLAAGASLVGKTQMDQLAWGTLGRNEHYGTPRNPAAQGRFPGGSSSGSACAVAGCEVDFALGTDSACSVRLPAALCGIYGIRPTLVEYRYTASSRSHQVLTRSAGSLARLISWRRWGACSLTQKMPPPVP